MRNDRSCIIGAGHPSGRRRGCPRKPLSFVRGARSSGSGRIFGERRSWTSSWKCGLKEFFQGFSGVRRKGISIGHEWGDTMIPFGDRFAVWASRPPNAPDCPGKRALRVCPALKAQEFFTSKINRGETLPSTPYLRSSTNGKEVVAESGRSSLSIFIRTGEKEEIQRHASISAPKGRVLRRFSDKLIPMKEEHDRKGFYDKECSDIRRDSGAVVLEAFGQGRGKSGSVPILYGCVELPGGKG